MELYLRIRLAVSEGMTQREAAKHPNVRFQRSPYIKPLAHPPPLLTSRGGSRGEQCSPRDQFANHRDATCPLVCTAGYPLFLLSSFLNEPASRQTWSLLSFGLTHPECLTKIEGRKFNHKTAYHYPLFFQGVVRLTLRVSEGSSPAVRTNITHCFCSLFWISKNTDPANSYTRSYTGFGDGR
ncbi:hypothetical protein FKW54_12020 [Acetobacter pomorum]|nr:hypothetical protein FKW54_12020 [Acetobacter pomorum]